jgi:hypothetical protein
MTSRHRGRLEGILLTVVVTAASALAVGGVWRVTEIAEHNKGEACEAVATAHKDTLGQVVALALALVALRKLSMAEEDPPT